MADSVCYRHPDRETFVSCTRCERLICPDCMKPASVGFQCPSCIKEGAATVRQPRTVYGGKAHATPLVTQALIGINVAVFLLMTASGTGFVAGGTPSSLFQRFAMVPTLHFQGGVISDGIAQGQYYRLLTATFLHYGIIHIALNMLCLYQLGPYVERTLGRVRFAGLYLLSGVAGSALSYSLGAENTQAAGASGAVFGLFAAFFVLERKRGGDVSQIGATIAFNLVISFGFAGYIDWRGHVGGLVGGALLALALVHAPAGERRGLYQAAGFLAVLVLVVAVVATRTAELTA